MHYVNVCIYKVCLDSLATLCRYEWKYAMYLYIRFLFLFCTSDCGHSRNDSCSQEKTSAKIYTFQLFFYILYDWKNENILWHAQTHARVTYGWTCSYHWDFEKVFICRRYTKEFAWKLFMRCSRLCVCVCNWQQLMCWIIFLFPSNSCTLHTSNFQHTQNKIDHIYILNWYTK